MKTIQQARKLQPFMPAAKVQSTGAGGGGGVSVHDFLGGQHNLPTLAANLFLASPIAGGTPSFRAIDITDFQSAADGRYALRTRQINANGGLTGSGDLTADIGLAVGQGIGITVNANDVAVNEGYAFAWTGQQTWTLPLRAVGATGGFEIDDRTTAGAAHRWAIYANSDTMRWAFNGTDKLWLQSTGTLRSVAFTAGFTGNGWQIDENVTGSGSNAQFDNVTVRNTFRAYEILIHKIRSGLGSYMFTPGGKVSTVTGGPTYTITFETDHGLAANDILHAQKFDAALGGTHSSTLLVATAPTTTQITATVLAGSNPAVAYEYIRRGNTTNAARRGGVYITADDTAAPYILVFDGVDSVAAWSANAKTRFMAGKLDGMTGGTNEYGMYAGDGGIANTNKYAIISTASARFNNIDFDIYSGGVRTFRVDAATPYLGLGNPNPTSFLGANGFWVGNASGTYKWHVGNVSAGALTEGMSWNGSAMEVRTTAGGVKISNVGIDIGHSASLTYYNSDSVTFGRISGASRYWFMQSDGTNFYIVNAQNGSPFASASFVQFSGGAPYTVKIVGSGLDIGSPSFTSVGQGDVRAGGTIHAGSTATDYTPTGANWNTAGTTLLLNALTYSAIGFHDSGSRVDFIRVGAGVITLGYDGGFGAAAIQMPNGFAQIGSAGSAAALALFRGAAAVDNRLWDIATDNTNLYIRALNDAYDFGVNVMQATRSGASISSVLFPSGWVGFRGPLGSATGVDEVRVGVESGVPRVTLEDAGQTLAAIDNSLGTLRIVTPGASVRATFDASGNFVASGNITATGNVAGVNGVFSGNIETNAGVEYNFGGYTGTPQTSTGYITAVIDGVGTRLLAWRA
jgi:hypothetical protein